MQGLQIAETVLLILLGLGQVASWSIKPWRALERIEGRLDDLFDEVDEVRAALLDLVQIQGVPEGSAIRRLRSRERQHNRESA